MKVIFVPPFAFSFMPPGGGVTQIVKTKQYLEQLGIDVDFWEPRSNYAISKSVDIFHIFSSDWPFGQLAAMLKGLGYPYVVSTVFYQPRWVGALAHALLSRVPLTQTAWRRRLLEHADLLLPNSYVEAKQLARIFGIPKEKFIIVPNAVDANFLGRDPERFRKKFLPELPLNEPFVLSVALIEKRKNTLALIKASSKVGVPLMLIGRPRSGEEKYVRQVYQELERLRQKLFIKHIPYIDATLLADAYAAAHVHALVSFQEVTGIANLEAGLNGANLVVSALPTVLEYLGQHAWVVDPYSVKSIACGLEKALNAPRNAKKADEHIRKNFTWEKAAEKTLAAYRRVLDK
jgi:glycosyltransferase involved in cell wall biosynthesis